MGGRTLHRPHFMEDHRNIPANQLPGGFGTGETAADYMNNTFSGQISHAWATLNLPLIRGIPITGVVTSLIQPHIYYVNNWY
jgi:hypothetical protein